MSFKLLPPPRARQKTAPVFGGRTVPRPLPHHPQTRDSCGVKFCLKEETMSTLDFTETLDSPIDFLINEGKTITLTSGKYGEYTVPTVKYHVAVSLLIKRALHEDKDEIDYVALDEMLYPYHI